MNRFTLKRKDVLILLSKIYKNVNVPPSAYGPFAFDELIVKHGWWCCTLWRKSKPNCYYITKMVEGNDYLVTKNV